MWVGGTLKVKYEFFTVEIRSLFLYNIVYFPLIDLAQIINILWFKVQIFPWFYSGLYPVNFQ